MIVRKIPKYYYHEFWRFINDVNSMIDKELGNRLYWTLSKRIRWWYNL